MRFTPSTLFGVLAVAGTLVLSGAHAAVLTVPISNVIAFEQGDFPNPGRGSVSRLADGSGLTKTDLEDITTWGHDTNWETGWQGNGTFPGTQAWIVFDLGAAVGGLESLYLWNVNEVNATNRGLNEFKLWYATAPAVALPATQFGEQPYNFSSGGWAQLGTVHTLAIGTGTAGLLYSGVYDLSGIPSARYVAIEAVSNYGSTIRTGLAEAVITSSPIPEPATYATFLGLLALGATAVRRSRSKDQVGTQA